MVTPRLFVALLTSGTVLLPGGVAETAPSGCLSLTTDCGARASQNDDTEAFLICQARLAMVGGCVIIPEGDYQVMGVPLNTSHIHWHFSSGAVVRPFHGYVTDVDYKDLFIIGATDSTGENVLRRNATPVAQLVPVRNISFTGPADEYVFIDNSKPIVCPWPVRAVRFGTVTNFTIANVKVLMANNHTNPALPCPGTRPSLGMDHGPDAGSPSHGLVENITALDGWPGYGLIQVQTATYVHFEHLDSTGGVTLRMETGGDNGYVGDITANNLICRNGSTALMAGAHAQQNGVCKCSYSPP